MIQSREMSAMADQPTVRALRLISYNLGAMALLYGVFYAGPSVLVRYVRTPEEMEQQVSVVQYLESFGPVWTILFTLAGLVVVAATFTGRNLVLAHGIAAGVWVSYGTAIVIGALSSVPPTPVLSGLAAVFGAVTHVGMARAWAGEGIR